MMDEMKISAIKNNDVMLTVVIACSCFIFIIVSALKMILKQLYYVLPISFPIL